MMVCPGCGLELPDRNLDPAEHFNASGECLDTYFALTSWTLVRQDNRFIHQHAADAYGARHSGDRTRTITPVFALIGLFLAVEKGYAGRKVQLAIGKNAKKKKIWPRLEPPECPATLTVMDVLEAETDEGKEEMLMQWAISVWQSRDDLHPWVRETTEKALYGERW